MNKEKDYKTFIQNFLASLIGGYLASLYSANMFFILSIILLSFIISLAVIMKIKYKL